jgi:hypothetical protein
VTEGSNSFPLFFASKFNTVLLVDIINLDMAKIYEAAVIGSLFLSGISSFCGIKKARLRRDGLWIAAVQNDIGM